MSEIETATSIDNTELELLQEAFWDGRFAGVLPEHEGATQTFLFEIPQGHIGFTVGLASGKGDISMSVSRWRKEQHHEMDRWIWTRVLDEQ